jgi:hypothetical protein
MLEFHQLAVSLEVGVTESVVSRSIEIDVEPVRAGRFTTMRQDVDKERMAAPDVVKNHIEPHAQRTLVALVDEMEQVGFAAQSAVDAKGIDDVIAVRFRFEDRA